MEHHSGEFFFSTPGTEPTGAPNTQATTIGLGRLFLQIAYCNIPAARFQLQDESVSKLRRIWPPGDNDFLWPLPLALDATDIAIILRSIHSTFEDTLILLGIDTHGLSLSACAWLRQLDAAICASSI